MVESTYRQDTMSPAAPCVWSRVLSSCRWQQLDYVTATPSIDACSGRGADFAPEDAPETGRRPVWCRAAQWGGVFRHVQLHPCIHTYGIDPWDRFNPDAINC